MPGQGAEESVGVRGSAGRSARWRRDTMPLVPSREICYKRAWIRQTGHERLTGEEASKWDLKWGAMISRGGNGKLGGGWNILEGRNHLGKAGGWGAGERKREEGASRGTLPQPSYTSSKARLSPRECAVRRAQLLHGSQQGGTMGRPRRRQTDQTIENSH